MAEVTASNLPVISEVLAFNRTDNGEGVAAAAQGPMEIGTATRQLDEPLPPYTIGDKLSFCEFIEGLRRILANHQDREDICDHHEDANLSSSQKHPLLAKPRADQQPARWIRVKLQVVEGNETASTTLIMRDDNVDVMGFINQKGHLYELGYRRMMLPPQFNSSVLLGWGNSYKSILSARNVEEVMDALVSAKLDKAFATSAVRVLSRFRRSDAADDGDNPRLAVVGLMFMVSESARMNPVHQAITRGWDTGTGFTKQLMTDYVWKYEDMSRRLRQWKRGNYAEQRPNSELRDIYLVLNDEYDLLSFACPEMLKVSFPDMFKVMSMATVLVNLRPLEEGWQSMEIVYGKISALIKDKHRNSVNFRVGSRLFACTEGIVLCSNPMPLEVARSVVAVPSGWVLHIEVDLRIKTTSSNPEMKHLNVILNFDNDKESETKSETFEGVQVEVKITGNNDEQQDFPLQLTCPVEVKMVSGYLTVVYTIGDEMSFTEFIVALRRTVADHPYREDILDGHDLLNLSSSRDHPVLTKQRPRQPARWLHIKLQVVEGEKTSWTTLVMRDDNLYVHGFMNQQGVCYELLDPEQNAPTNIFPSTYNPRPLYWGLSYKSILGTGTSHDAVHKLAGVHLGRKFVRNAVRRLSSSRHPDDEVPSMMSASLALAGLILMVCESARMNPLHDFFVRGWSDGARFTKELMDRYVWRYGDMSSKLLAWKSGWYAKSHPIQEVQAIYLVLNTMRTRRGNPDRQQQRWTTWIGGRDGDSSKKPSHHRGDGSNAGRSGGKRKRAYNDGSGVGMQSQRKKGCSFGSGGNPASKSEDPCDADSGGGPDSKSENASDADNGGSTDSDSQSEESGDYYTGSPAGSDEAGDSGSSGGNSSGQPGEDEDAQGRGRPRVELLSMRADLGLIGTKIVVFDGKRGQIIYTKEEQGEQGGMVDLVLTGPYKAISAYGCFAIEIDIPEPAAEYGDAGGSIQWEWDFYDPKYADQVDQPPVSHTICTTDDSRKQVAEVTYAVMSNAREATVQVKLRLKDGHWSGVVNGEITALIDGFKDRSVLFSGAKGTTAQCLSPTEDGSWFFPLQLSRKVVAVPCGSALYIEVNLLVATDDGHQVEMKVPLRFDNGIRSSKTDDSKSVEVEVTWYPEMTSREQTREEIVQPGLSLPAEITRPEQTREEIGQLELSLPEEDKMMFGNQVEVVHSTIGDGESFTNFIKELRDILAEHPDREDIFELRPLLVKQHAEQPARWLHIKLQVVEGMEMSSITLLMRDDNLYVCGFINRNGILCRLVDNEDSESFLPGGFHTSTVQLGVSYHSLLQAKNRDDVVRKLTAAQLGSGFAMGAVRVLSRHPNKVAGIDMSTGVALAGLIFIVCESARMISVHKSIEAGWSNGKGFTEKLMYDSVWKYVEMSSKLQAWKIGNYAEPHPISELQATSLVLNTMLPDVDAKGHGRPRVELLAIRADLRVVGTKITVFDGKRGQIIYRHEKQGAEQGRMVDLELTGPYTCISASGCFAIKIDIPNSPPIKWEWDCYDPKYANQVDGPPVTHMICTPDDSRKQVAEVTYAVMSNAREATVQVKLRLKDGHWSGVVNGEITALIDGFKDRSVLFSGAKGTTAQCLSPTEDGSWFFPLQLSRKVVAVPCGSALYIEVNLLVATDDGHQVEMKVPLRFDNGIRSSKTDDSKSVEVEVTWYPEIPPQSHPPEQITSKEADVDKFITAPSEQSEPPEVKTVPSEHVTVVYTIGDELLFTDFIGSLRRILADYPDREDVLDEHPKFSSLSSTGERHPVLPKQRAEQPARWIHIKLQAMKGEEMMSTTLLMRDDNLYVCGFMNQQGELFELMENPNRSANILPVDEYNPQRLSWGVSYRSLLDADAEDDLVRILSSENMGCDFMMQAMHVLSRFPAWVVDHMNPRSHGNKQMNPRMAVAGLIVMVCESARMNRIHNMVTASWWIEDSHYIIDKTRRNLTRNYVSNYYGWTSCELLTWKSKGYTNPHPISKLQDIYLALNYRLEPPPQAGRAESSRRTQGTTPQRRRWMAGDAKGHGRPRVEVLAMRADIGVVGTTVMVFDGKRGHIIYKDEQGKQGMADLVLTGPCKSISAYGCFAIKIDIPPGAALGSSRKGDAGGSIKWEWDCYDQEYRKEVDKPPVTRTINRNVEVTYAVMSEAFEATVQVKMMRLRDGNSTGIVHGNIKARIGDLKDDYKEPLEEKDYYKEEIILFKRTEEMGQHFSPTDSRVLQLSRSVIAVPHRLLIKMDLQIETSSDNQQRLKPQPFNTTFEFKSGIWGQRRHEVDGNEVEVTVTWYPEVSSRWDDISREERQAILIESDVSYMIGDSGEGFSAFITELRRLIVDHPHRKDIDVLGQHPDPVLSSMRNHPVLPASGIGYRQETIRSRWLLHIKLHAGLGVETPSITLAMRAHTLEILGFKNQSGQWFNRWLGRGLPREYNPTYLGRGETYQSILGVGSWKEIMDRLNSKGLGKTFAADAVSLLSRFHGNDAELCSDSDPEEAQQTRFDDRTEVMAGGDGDDPKLALVGLMVMVCESAKFNPIHDEIVRGWKDGTGLTEQLMHYIKNWREMSTALLDWKDHLYQGWPRNKKLENIKINSPDDALDKVHLVCNDPAKRFATR